MKPTIYRHALHKAVFHLLPVLALSVGIANAADDPHLGRNLAATCANCHGTNGNAVGNEMKPLAGMEKAKILESVKAYQSGDKPASIMHQIAKGYTDAQLNLIAEYYSRQKR